MSEKVGFKASPAPAVLYDDILSDLDDTAMEGVATAARNLDTADKWTDKAFVAYEQTYLYQDPANLECAEDEVNMDLFARLTGQDTVIGPRKRQPHECLVISMCQTKLHSSKNMRQGEYRTDYFLSALQCQVLAFRWLMWGIG